MTVGRGSRLLAPLRSVREMDLTVPPGTPAEDVLNAIAAQLKRKGNRVEPSAGGTLEFRRVSGSGGMPMDRAAATVSGGVVTLDMSAAPARARVELRYSRWLTFFFPAVAVGAVVLTEGSAWVRLGVIAVLAGLIWLNCSMGRYAYHTWIAEAALGAIPGGGAPAGARRIRPGSP
ncbi:MAG TPA: hypothetical protein VFJ16_19085 [Longimicrobium sp.]|nr:hypothetical protein [Longimicrobium sp.]